MKLTPGQLGHRAAAQGEVRPTCPFAPGSPEGKEWLTAYGNVEAHRAAGRDPNGHRPINPHLCVRDVSKVCNCCTACVVECRREADAPTPWVIRQAAPWIGSAVLHMMRGALLTAGATRMLRIAIGRAYEKIQEAASDDGSSRAGAVHQPNGKGSGEVASVDARAPKCDHTKNAQCVEPGGCAFAREVKAELAERLNYGPMGATQLPQITIDHFVRQSREKNAFGYSRVGRTIDSLARDLAQAERLLETWCGLHADSNPENLKAATGTFLDRHKHR